VERWSKVGLTALGLAWVVFALAPNFVDAANQRLLARMFVLGLLAMSLNILLGNAGIVSFGHGLFYGTGAYTVTLLWLHKDWPPLLGLVLAPFVCAVFAAIGGLVAFRARRLYFGLLTLALSQFGFVIATQWYSVTQGENGIHGVELPDWLVTTSAKYWFVFGVFTGALVLIRMLLASPFGTTLRAIRENRERVAFLGVNAIRYEFAAFVISGAFAGLAGGLLVVLDQDSFPMLYHWTTSAEPLLMIVIGGAATFLGPVLGAGVVVFVQDYLRDVTQHINLLYGIVVLLIALGAPGGLSGIAKSAVLGGPRLVLDRLRRGTAVEPVLPALDGTQVARPDYESPESPESPEVGVTR
jgi:branched-chain amino acid transport system permease protein